MCAILDANRYGDYLNEANRDMAPVRKWMSKGGKLLHSDVGNLAVELDRLPKMRRKFLDWQRAGKIKRFAPEVVEDKRSTLTDLVSDDPHAVALAMVGNAKLLISNDEDLGKDFKRKTGGKIYKYASHRRFLRGDTCP